VDVGVDDAGQDELPLGVDDALGERKKVVAGDDPDLPALYCDPGLDEPVAGDLGNRRPTTR